ncbi:uncharacterized protein hdly [Chelonus insularis]|uniref:uncharacterized protein hdly n=1 Tax=Chelonus insularis TaxID=460826 RepID=UPI001588D106|nr:uncharacterized protein LOC118074780 [Chelonus insularis]
MPAFKNTKDTMFCLGNYLVILMIIMMNISESMSKPTVIVQSTNVMKSNKYLPQDINLSKKSINIKNQRQLDQLLRPRIKEIIKRDASIEKLKDDSLFPVLRVTPISLVELGYYPDEREVFYEEDMDELLKLQKKLHILNNQNKRGDINPILMEYYDNIESGDDKIPVRGDLVRRNKRSSDDYDEYWGYGEDEGVKIDDEVNKDNRTLPNNYLPRNNNDNVAEYKRNYEQRNFLDSSNSQMEMELEKKLKDYIAHNQPIMIRRKNKHDMNNVSNKLQIHLKSEHERMLNKAPVSAQIIILKNSSRGLEFEGFEPRSNFEGEIDFPGINPNREGLEATHFPSSARTTPKPRREPPGACIWAIVQCCTSSVDRLTRCFEHMGCPGVNWDSDPCRRAVADAARAEILKYYANTE